MGQSTSERIRLQRENVYNKDNQIKKDDIMNHTADAKQFCHHLWHQYLEERSYEIPGGYFSPQISVIGTGKHEVSHSL